jgi:hypothetical protein
MVEEEWDESKTVQNVFKCDLLGLQQICNSQSKRWLELFPG